MRSPGTCTHHVIAFALLTLSALPALANVSGYSFAASAGTYTPIVGTVVASGTWDDLSSPLLTLPFTFTYNNTDYTTVGITTNGFITMGAVPATTYCGLQTSAANSIAGYGTDLVNASATSSIQYTTRGAAPNRQFVVQWTDCDHYGNGQQNHWVFQIILNETSNTVQVVYGPSTDATTTAANNCADVSTESGNVGLVGASNADFNIRMVNNQSTTWNASEAGAAITAVCVMAPTSIPANGLTWTWTPPVPTPMTFVSATTTFLNNGQVDARSSMLNTILQVKVVTTGNLSPFSVSSLALSTTGSTNAAADIASARVYYTGGNNTFSTATQYGAAVNDPNGAYAVNGSVTLQEGNNYFWVTYDIKINAVLNDQLAGCCTQVTGSGTMGAQVPTVSCPGGTHTVGEQLGTWTPLASSAPHGNGGVMLVLSDGTVMAKTNSGLDGTGNLWDKLTPNASGSYVNGTWSTLAGMINSRLYFSSYVLKDGRVYVAGGEYGSGLSAAETYDPLLNTWTAAPSPGANVSDANAVILEDGRVLQALVAGSLRSTVIYNPATNTYSPGPTCLGIHNESSWVKLPDNSVLFVDRLSTNSERYIPASNTWIADATVPVALYDPFGDETGPGLLLPDGRAFFIGSMGHTAYYLPSGSTAPGQWVAGPDVPNALGAPDAAGALMVNGKVLCAVSPIPTSADHFPPPTYFYEFDPATNVFSLINAPGGATSLNSSSYIHNMVDLPDGSVLYSRQGSSQYHVYNPAGVPLASAKPAITSVAQDQCGIYSITGTGFNGVTEGAYYGDDWQMSTNFPLVRLTNGANVYYARTSNWNSTGVQRGSLPDNAQFTLPAGLPAATYALVVVANGIASDPVSFTPSTTITPTASVAITAGANPTTPGASITFTVTATGGGATPTYEWRVNGGIVGTNSPSFTTSSLTNGQVVTCTLGSTLACASPVSVTSPGVTISVIGARVAAKVFLEGPYVAAEGSMVDSLRVRGLLPLTEPYTALGYTHAGGGGGEVTTAPVLAVTGSNAIVDWVIVELRDASNATTVLASHAALLQRDGDVVGVDGVSPVSFALPGGNYFVAVRHANHLGAMALNALALSTTPTVVDLSVASTATYGTEARKSITGAFPVQALWAGDVTFNGIVKYTGAGNDRDPILVTVGSTTPNNTVSVYSTRDVNLNGQVKYTGSGNDRDPILVNVGSTTPNNVRVQQLP